MTNETIGYLFDAAQLDLKHHLPIIGDFWETLVLEATLIKNTDIILYEFMPS
jgi:hypothetical protein